MRYLEGSNPYRQKVERWLSGGRVRVLVGENEKVLEMGDGDG